MTTPALGWADDAWREETRNAVTGVADLAAALDLAPDALDWDVAPDFPLRVPRPYLSRMKPGDPEDPLLAQVAPRRTENTIVPGWSADPLDEQGATVTAGLVQKYAGRALVVATGACAVHCRYCFRRHFPYEQHRHDRSFPMLEHVEGDPTIREVILSGGDPLILSDERIAALLDRIEAIDHVERIRIHTRLPVVIPQRVNAPLLELLERRRLPLVIVLHFNHANEIDDDTAEALRALYASGATLLNQSVLLQGVNDSAEALVELSEALFAQRILPYYVHLPDRVAGTAHFDVPKERALCLFADLRTRLPGYLVPRLVRETPGSGAKDLVF